MLTKDEICRATLLLVVLAAFQVPALNAQRPVERPLDVRERGRGISPSGLTTTRSGVLMAPAPAAVAEPRFTVDFQPSFLSSSGRQETGATLAFNNDSLLSNVPFTLEVTDRIVTSGGQSHNLVQVDGLVLPFPDLNVSSVTITPNIIGTFSHESGVGTGIEGLLELDGTLIQSGASKTKLVLAALAYYDHFVETDGPTSEGLTFGSLAQIAWHALRLEGEYDFSSEFAGGDYFTIRLAAVVPVARVTLTPFVGAAKHDLFKFGVKVNVPENRQTHPTIQDRGP